MHIGIECKFLSKIESSPRKIFFAFSQGPKLKSDYMGILYTKSIKIPKPKIGDTKIGKNRW